MYNHSHCNFVITRYETISVAINEEGLIKLEVSLKLIMYSYGPECSRSSKYVMISKIHC